ncbi:MAG: tetratricopeptide repeat protein [Planctomycetes bacterium]|nr:tetratricopeptide repeat protein [Planctomycetota bacterium]
MSNDLIRAQQLLELGRQEEAARLLGRHLAEDPGDWFALCLMALATSGDDRPQEATEFARRAVVAAPNEAYARVVESDVLHSRGWLDEAESAAREAIRLDANYSSGFACLAEVLASRKKWREALDAADEGLRLDPEDDACANARAICLTKLGRRAEAVATLEGTLTRDPGDASAHANLGWTALHDRDYSKAERHFREALRLNPTSEWAREGVVECLRARNWLYRPVLQFFLWVRGLDTRLQVGIVFGGWLLYRFAQGRTEGDSLFAWSMVAVVGAYFAFVIATWFAEPLMDSLLTLDSFGRIALTRAERRDAWIVVGLLLLGVAMLCAGIGVQSPAIAYSGVSIALLTLPLKIALDIGEPSARRGMFAYFGALALFAGYVTYVEQDGRRIAGELLPFAEEGTAICDTRDELEARRQALLASGWDADFGEVQAFKRDLAEFERRNSLFEERGEELELVRRVDDYTRGTSRRRSLWTIFGVLCFIVSQFVAVALVKRARRR